MNVVSAKRDAGCLLVGVNQRQFLALEVQLSQRPLIPNRSLAGQRGIRLRCKIACTQSIRAVWSIGSRSVNACLACAAAV
jgi:hypothetical protein